MAKAKKVNTDSMGCYAEAGFTLIPLHPWMSKSKYKDREREDGKRPLHPNWTKRPYSNAEAINLAEENGNNVGVRLTAEQLVIDVDPRNMPTGPDGEAQDTFQKLCKAMSLDLDGYPKVETGSGGLHVYMTKPADVSVVDTAEGYPGVEFKTRGRQVVSAGSIHPNGTEYRWDFLGPPLAEMKPAPDRLMALIRRPVRTTAMGPGGEEHDQTEIAEMLEHMDPSDFGSGKDVGGIDWFKLMAAAHHASGGEARTEFIDWSTRDPDYADEGWVIGRRWDSLHRKGPEGHTITRNTLFHVLTKLDKASAIPMRDDADQDFDDDIVLPGDELLGETPVHEKKGALGRMNDIYCTVKIGDKFRIARELYNPSTDRTGTVFYTEANFKSGLRNRSVKKFNKKGEYEAVPIASEWLAWPHCRDYEGVLFDPEHHHKGWLNLWTGWGVEPKPGDWSLMQELIHEALCAGDKDLSDFVFNWCAAMVQRPWEPAEVAICFWGDQGTGKSTLGKALTRICGRHGLQLTNQKHVTGAFNKNLMETVFLFADEAVAPTNRKAQGAMKALITEDSIIIKSKGLNAFPSKSRLHVMMASKFDWFVNASSDGHEHRYFISEVSKVRQQDFPFFADLDRQMYKEGGLEAMLHDLQTRDITGWVPRSNIPKTKALADQKLLNLNPVAKWWFNALDMAEFPCDFSSGEDVDWTQTEVRGFIEHLKESFAKYCAASKINPNPTNRDLDRFFWKEVSKMCPSLTEKRDTIPDDVFVKPAGSSRRARCKAFPPLAQCREEFDKWLGSSVEWSTNQN